MKFDPKLPIIITIISSIGDWLLFTRKVSKRSDNKTKKRSGSLMTELFAQVTDNDVFGLVNSSDIVL